MRPAAPCVLALVLAGCAPTASGPAVADPVFAPGQQWVLGGSKPTSSSDLGRPVPARDYWSRRVATYTDSAEMYDWMGIRSVFQYSPAGTLPEFISYKTLLRFPSQNKAYMVGCVVRTPGKVEVGQSLPGLSLFEERDVNVESMPKVQTYLRGADPADGEGCTLKRVK